MKLNNARIQAARPSDKPYMIGDGVRALYVRISPTGHKAFVLRLRHGGRARKVTLGAWPHLSLSEARQQASAWKAGAQHHVANGSAATTSAVVQEFYDTLIAPNYKSVKNAKVYVRVVQAELAGTAVRRVTRSQVARMVTAHRRRGPVAANRLLEFTKRFFSWCVESGYIDSSLAAGITRRVAGGEETSRARVLTDAEIVAMWNRPHPSTTLFRFLLLTGLRIGEAQKARVEHIEGDVLTVPPANSKNGRAHRVHLVPLALAQVVPGAAPYLFAQRTATGIQHSLRRWQGNAPDTWAPHDLRRSFASRQAAMGTPPHVIQALLNHTMEGTLPVYVRGNTYWDERVRALEMWSSAVALKMGPVRDRCPKMQTPAQAGDMHGAKPLAVRQRQQRAGAGSSRHPRLVNSVPA